MSVARALRETAKGRRWTGVALSVAFAACVVTARAATPGAGVANPHPVKLMLPQSQPLSPMAQLGKAIFYDPSLSGSGQLSCASCHSPAHAYGPPTSLPVAFGGPSLTSQGARAVPSLEYLERQPIFTIGPDSGTGDDQPAPPVTNATRLPKTAQGTVATAANFVPQGGLFWDGRANTLMQQAQGPLFNPIEMDAGTMARVAAKLQAAPYAPAFTALFGPRIFATPNLLVAEALFAVARYQIEDVSFHPYISKYDAWLQGKAVLTPQEYHGYQLFNDSSKANCGGCHLDQPTADHQPPLFTDHQFEALGVPRNPDIRFNQSPAYYDLGLCGPYRTDQAAQTQYCALFLTPTLRNVALRQVFFHNGVYHTLQQVLDFYDFRDTQPQKIYPPGQKYNDIPAPDQANVDSIDPPFNRHLGDPPAMSPQDEQDIIAFLKTLTDGYKP